MDPNEQVMRHLNELECMGACDAEAIIAEMTKNRLALLADDALYYDWQQDLYMVENYYRDITADAETPAQLFENLNRLLSKSHKYQLPYYVSKDQYLYTWVDLQRDGRLACIYSGERKSAEQAIEEDFEAIRKRFARYRELVVNRRFGEEEFIRQIKKINGEYRFNTEHVVPQSWFSDQEPMKGDLHHLFVCEPRCNNSRANYHYAEFPPPDGDERHVNRCGAFEPGRFEPRHGKGMAARAMLYFLLRYPGKIKKSFRNGIDIPLLLRWHRQYPVTEFEKHRNKAIYEIQGNRNPLIDFPQLADKIDFSVALRV